MDTKNKQHVCPVEGAGGLDNALRRLLQNPQKIVRKYIHSGMSIMDIGCGPGFFTVEMAKVVKENGHVVAVDLQKGMLDKLQAKISGTKLENVISLHQCEPDKIAWRGKVDFIFAFYMVHEVPDPVQLFEELKTLLNSDGKILVVEPKFHVNKKTFYEMIDIASRTGLEIEEQPKMSFSRAVLLRHKK